ncbi:hypothetical protein [Candidimonas sp. SYP-B2681]|uniref:hypothetical protein n=1 Tax=Candidimonas sp. SYP-B2681 TaxID=2497686 RepID=UPI0013158798|nr:hypothetical protein [Candidimonas sp. SYP-B2681]
MTAPRLWNQQEWWKGSVPGLPSAALRTQPQWAPACIVALRLWTNLVSHAAAN